MSGDSFVSWPPPPWTSQAARLIRKWQAASRSPALQLAKYATATATTTALLLLLLVGGGTPFGRCL